MYLRITVKTSFRDTSVVDIVLGRYWLVDWRRRVTCKTPTFEDFGRRL
jgi:hypothetical protein